MPDYFAVGSIILDDIVFPDGSTRMGILGGGATHAAMGMRLWTDSVGLVAPIGNNFQKHKLDEMSKLLDTEGLQQHAVPTPRAWQVYEEDGRRTEVFRTDFEQFLSIAPNPVLLPNSYAHPKGVHLLCDSPEPLLSWIRKLRRVGCQLILWEPWDITCQQENRDDIYQTLPLVDVFSPNLIEAQRITGKDDVESIAGELLSANANCVVIRMGSQGSYISDRQGTRQQIPIVPVENVIDVTGAGNAYCGGFLVGLAESRNIVQAGLRGAVSASFALEQFGALYSVREVGEKIKRRLAILNELIQDQIDT